MKARVLFTLLFLYLFGVWCTVTERDILLPEPFFYPYGPNTTDILMDPNDDGSEQLFLSSSIPYFDTLFSSVYINNNGMVSFDVPVSAYTPLPFPLSNGVLMIAPYWGDVDTRGAVADGNQVYYRLVTPSSPDSDLLNRATQEVAQFFSLQTPFTATQMVIASWHNVGKYSLLIDKLNTYQLVIVSNGLLTFAFYHYSNLEWTPASAGFNGGDDFNFFNLPGSLTPEVVDLVNKTNCNTPGRFIFRVDTSITPGGCAPGATAVFRPSQGSEMGGTTVSFRGPCFEEGAELMARFGTQQVPVTRISDFEAIAFTPPSMSAFANRVSVYFSMDGGNTWTSTYRTFTYLQAFSDKPRVNVTTQSGYVTTNTDYELEFTPLDDEFEGVDEMNVTVSLWKYRTGSGKKRVIPQVILVGRVVWTVARNPVVRLSLTAARIANDIANGRGDTYFFAVNTVKRQLNSVIFGGQEESCREWANEDSMLGDDWGRDLPDCPASIRTDSSLPIGWIPDAACTGRGSEITSESDSIYYEYLQWRGTSCFYHRDASECIRSSVATTTGAIQQCCYDANGFLTRNGVGAGTPDRGGNLFTHYIHDVLPAKWCGCDGTNLELCKDVYLRKRAPNQGSTDPRRWRPTRTFGDPHFTSLDGKDFLFNGIGEYTFLKDTASDFEMQIRTTLLSFGSNRASIITAVALQQDGSSFGVYMSSRNVIDFYHDGERVEHVTQYSQLTLGSSQISIEVDNTKVTLTFLLPNSVEIIISTRGQALSIMMLLPDEMQGRVQGLVGNWNDNPDDDFTTSNGTTLPSTASLQDIHYIFGQSWQVNENTTLFVYPLGTSVEDFSDPNFQPTFTTPAFQQPDLENAILSICNNVTLRDECIFDAAVSQSLDFARESLLFNNVYQNTLNRINTGPNFANPVASFDVIVGTRIEHNFGVSDIEGDTFTLSILRGPSGSMISPTGVFSWEVSVVADNVDVSIGAVDSRGAHSGISFQIHVTSPDSSTTSSEIVSHASTTQAPIFFLVISLIVFLL